MKIFLINEAIIQEGVEEITDLMKVADFICDWLHDNYADSLLEFVHCLETNQQFDLKDLFKPERIIITNIDPNEFKEDLGGFLTQSSLIIKVQRYDLNLGEAAFSEDGSLYINLNYILVKLIKIYEKQKKTIFLQKTKQEQYIKIKEVIDHLYKNLIVHELQHAYDSFRSKGKYKSDQLSKKFYGELKKDPKNYISTKEGKEIYLMLPHEYWARFSQFISKIVNPYFEFHPLLKKFEKEFDGYSNLPQKDRQRLLKALHKYFISQQK